MLGSRVAARDASGHSRPGLVDERRPTVSPTARPDLGHHSRLSSLRRVMLLRASRPCLPASTWPRWQRALSSKINWSSLGFDFVPTNSMVRYNYKDGAWDSGTMQSEFAISMHPCSNALHYGQALFEGLKAFHCQDGKVRVFNAPANHARMRNGCERMHMPFPDDAMFQDAIERVIKDNVEFVPPYGTGGAMYLRPFIFGHGAKIGLGPAVRAAPAAAARASPARRHAPPSCEAWRCLLARSASPLRPAEHRSRRPAAPCAAGVLVLRAGHARRRVLQGWPAGDRRACYEPIRPRGAAWRGRHQGRR